MIIVVEGIDRVGKTTLCNKLSKELNIPIFKDESFYKKTKDSSKIEIERMSTIINFIKQMNVSCIFDRFMWSEYVYGKVERGYENADCFEIEKRLGEIGAITILVVPENIQRSSEEHGKDLAAHEKEFFKLFVNAKMRTICCNYESIDRVVKRIKEIMEVELNDAVS